MRASLPACLALLLLLLGSATARADEASPEIHARALMADALFLESGMGDFRGALRLYREIVETTASTPTGLIAEAWLRMGLAHEALGEVEQAESAYQSLLAAHATVAWASDARSRLQSLDEDRRMVRSLPVAFAFDEDVGGLFHARSRPNKGRIDHETVEVGGQQEGLVSWRTYVTSGEDDLLVLGFDRGLLVHGDIGVRVRAVQFPVHLSFILVDREGTRFVSLTFIVRPEEGWQQLALEALDFQDRSEGSGGASYRPRTGLGFLMIQDVTGHNSTDRGENLILLDDLAVR